MSRRDDVANRGEHRGIGLIEELRADLGVPIDPQHQPGEVVGSDGDTVNSERCVLTDDHLAEPDEPRFQVNDVGSPELKI